MPENLIEINELKYIAKILCIIIEDGIISCDFKFTYYKMIDENVNQKQNEIIKDPTILNQCKIQAKPSELHKKIELTSEVIELLKLKRFKQLCFNGEFFSDAKKQASFDIAYNCQLAINEIKIHNTLEEIKELSELGVKYASIIGNGIKLFVNTNIHKYALHNELMHSLVIKYVNCLLQKDKPVNTKMLTVKELINVLDIFNVINADNIEVIQNVISRYNDSKPTYPNYISYLMEELNTLQLSDKAKNELMALKILCFDKSIFYSVFAEENILTDNKKTAVYNIIYRSYMIAHDCILNNKAQVYCLSGTQDEYIKTALHEFDDDAVLKMMIINIINIMSLPKTEDKSSLNIKLNI